ncbi:MAG: DUF5658 family protein [Candidatus Zhuqueibacterota bacterium]
MNKAAISERRKHVSDRRQQPTHFLNRHTLTGKRAYQRRAENRQTNHYVDRYGLKSLAVFAITLLLCALDARITLVLLSRGATELNPFLVFALKLGPTWFLLIKYTITGLCLLALLVHKNFVVFNYRLPVKRILFLVLFGYSLLILYEVWLLVSIK